MCRTPVRCARVGRSDGAYQGKRGQGDARQRPQGVRPAEDLNQFLGDWRKDELTERAAGIDDARGHAATFDRDAMADGADQHGKAPGARAGGGQNAQREDESPDAGHERRDEVADGQNDQTARQNLGRAVTVGECASDGLRQSPDELADGHGQADGGNAESGALIERGDKQAERLADAHGDHQQAGGGEDEQP